MSTFSELPLSPYLKERLASAGFTTPTPVQEASIPQGIDGKDVLATAQTGTGKTLAFLIPIAEHLLESKTSGVAALVLLPTRELAMQVAEAWDAIRGKRLGPAALVVGGLSEGTQITALRRGARLIVATPGRLEDFLDRRLVAFRDLKILVLDEADRMLDMGFFPSIRRITSILPRDRQTLCFSATLEASVAHLVRASMRHPVRVSIGSTLKPAENIRMQAFEVAMDQKYALLEGLLVKETGRVLIFTRTRRNAERLAKTLNRDGFPCARIHGDRTQSQRTAALSGFQNGRFRVLVATDVAARGIHVEDIVQVINYDLPEIAENYIHRVGRTARAGHEGVASTIITRDQRPELQQLERTLGLRIERLSPDSHVADAAAHAMRPRPATQEDESPRRGKRSRQGRSSRSGRANGPGESRHADNAGHSAESTRRSIVPLPGEFLQARM